MYEIVKRTSQKKRKWFTFNRIPLCYRTNWENLFYYSQQTFLAHRSVMLSERYFNLALLFCDEIRFDLC